MTAPIQPQRFDREGAKRAGYSDAEIDAFLAEDTAAPKKDDGRTKRLRPDNLVRQAMNAVTFGLNDELSGAADAAIRKVSGDKRPIGELYRTARDEVKNKSTAYSDENPKTALAAQTAGALATGRFLPNVPGFSNLTAGSRIGQAAANGAVQGAASGFGNADGSVGERAQGAALGGVAGGVAGGALSSIAELIRGGARVAGGVRDAVKTRNGAPLPINDTRAARDLLPTLQRAGVSVEDLRNADMTADPEDLLGELGNLRKRGVRTLASANRQGLRPEPISEALDTRAMDEAPRFSTKLETLTGQKIRDAGAVAEEAKAAAAPTIREGIGRAYQQPDVNDPRVLDVVETLADTKHGRPALDFAGDLAKFKGTQAPTMDPTESISVANLHNLRQGVDREIEKAVANKDGQLVAMLQMRRTVLDDVLKEAGGEGMRAADAAHAGAMGKAESFQLGEKLRSGAAPESATDEGIARMLAGAKDPEAVRMGAASNLMNTVRTASDGTAGAVTNPVRGQFGSPRVDARSRLAFADDASFSKARESAGNVTKRFQTRNQVLGGSQTQLNRADDDAEMGADMLKAAAKGKVGSAIEALWNFGNKGTRGATLDNKARMLLAGGGGENLTRKEAIDLLEAARPLLLRQARWQTGFGATSGNLGGGAVGKGVSR